MKMRSLLLILIGVQCFAGSFDSYSWRMGFLVGEGYYQATIKIEYEYDASSGFTPNMLALPNDDNLKVYRMNFKVDGQKAEPMEMQQVTYWSHGKPVPTWIPDREGKKIKATALYVIKNLFVIMPAPTHLQEPVKRLEVGFAPIQGFDLTGTFVGEQFKFKHRKIAARVGEPGVLYGIWRRNVKASSDPGLLFLIPKSFTFSFNNLRASQSRGAVTNVSQGPASASSLFGGLGTQAGSAGAGNADTAAGAAGFGIDGTLKPYTATFYHGNPLRDWKFVLTWLQQERTYLPFGVQPGGRVKSRSVFAGGGNKTDDLIPWFDVQPTKFEGDALVAAENAEPMDIAEARNLMEQVQLFIKDYRGSQNIGRNLSRLIAYDDGHGVISPAQANRGLANELSKRYQLKAVPALTSIFPKDRVSALPLAAFDRVVTAMKIDKSWFFVDAANPNWNLGNSMAFLKGHSVVIINEGDVQFGAF